MVPDELREALRKAKRRRGSPAWEQAVKNAATFVNNTISEKRELESWAHNFSLRGV
jgi:hypothetical protein